MLSPKKIEMVEAIIASQNDKRPHTVVLAEKTKMQQPNIQKYLGVLEKAKIIERQFTFKVNYKNYHKALLADKIVASLHVDKK